MIHIIPLNILPIQDDGFHLSFHAFIGKEPVHMLVDTGASRTVFDKEKICNLLNIKDKDLTENSGPSGGIGTTNLQSSVTEISELTLGTWILRSYPTALIDLQQVNILFRTIGLPEVDGILGGDLLEKACAVIDYGKKIMKLKVPKHHKFW